MSRQPAKSDPSGNAVQVGWRQIMAHPLFRTIGGHLVEGDAGDFGPDGWVVASPYGWIRYSPQRAADAEEWTWMLAHAVLHLGLGHADPRWARPADLGASSRVREGRARLPDPAYRAACCLAVDRFLRTLRLGRAPRSLPAEIPADDERALAEYWRAHGIPAWAVPIGPPDFLLGDEATAARLDHQRSFAAGVAAAATEALETAGGARGGRGRHDAPWDAALGWFVSSYPLLGALAAGMTVVADADLARGWGISIAAVSSEAAEIYVNPLARLSPPQWRFVLAHEMLHAALRHAERAGGRDPYLWNVACDYVVNGWLVQMEVGEPPDVALYDPTLADLSCEAVYDRIATDLRRSRKLATLRGQGVGDLLDRPIPRPGSPGRYVDLDTFYRNALSTALVYQENSGWGLIPAGLEQEIRALDQPPLPWDASLARWFDEHVPAVERRRTYARSSRRQSSTPGIPRPAWVRPEEVVRTATFGVVLDTSGSMDSTLLGKALGAIASFAVARDVHRVRVVFCDAAAYDAGYLHVDEIAGRVRVRGRGGTVLQPGISLLERAADFPPDAPILIITDGRCDMFRCRREHAVLMPAGATLPLHTSAPVFRIR